MTQAPTTGGVEPSLRRLMVAVTGPSAMSSYQSSLAQKSLSSAVPCGEADLPKPPRTNK
ncbi:MAG TPA: hypothetical protein VGE97_04815 [Nitrososphaera sp.]